MTEPMNDERAIALLDWLSGTNGGIVSIDDIDALNPYIAKRFREMVAAVPRPDPPEVDDAIDVGDICTALIKHQYISPKTGRFVVKPSAVRAALHTLLPLGIPVVPDGGKEA